MLETSIELDDVHFSYAAGVPVLNGLSLSVQQGAIFGLLGPNGAGKSTTFRILMGLDRPHSGRALIEGSPLTLKTREIYRRIGYMPDIGEVFDSSTVDNLLAFFGRAQQLTENQIRMRSDELLDRFDFVEHRASQLSKLSRGQRQQAHIMRSLIHSPAILILDEPASHLDPVRRQLLLEILREEARRGTTILISSHILPELSQFCTSIAIINKGKVLDHGRVPELIEKYQNKESSYQLRTTSGARNAAGIIQRHERTFHIKSLQVLSDDILRFDIDSDRDQIASLLEVLIRSGIRITEFERRRKDIEKIYIEMMRSAA
jgi:ABC-2 type transport system ATP-binding protein